MLSRFFRKSASTSRLSHDTADHPQTEVQSEHQPEAVARPDESRAQQTIVTSEAIEDLSSRTVKLSFPKDRRRSPPSETEIRRALGTLGSQVQRMGFKEKYAALVFESSEAADEFMTHWRDLFPEGYKARRVTEPRGNESMGNFTPDQYKEHEETTGEEARQDRSVGSPIQREEMGEDHEATSRPAAGMLGGLDTELPSIIIEEYEVQRPDDAESLSKSPGKNSVTSGVEEEPIPPESQEVLELPSRKVIASVRFEAKDSEAESPTRTVLSEDEKIRQLSLAFLRSSGLDRSSRGEDEVNMRSLSNIHTSASARRDRKTFSVASPPTKAINERPADPDFTFVSHVTDRSDQNEMSRLRERVHTLELEAELRVAEKSQLERGKNNHFHSRLTLLDVRQSEQRWAVELTALSVRVAGLERELREAHDIIRHLRVELAARDAEVAALEATKTEMETALESASSRAERDALGTVLAQSRLVAVLDRQRISNETLTSNLRDELESTREAYKKSQEELLQWKARALSSTGENSVEAELDEASYRAVAAAEFQGYIQNKSASVDDSVLAFPKPHHEDRKHTSVSPPNLYEIIEKDLRRTQQRLEQLQIANRRTMLVETPYRQPRRSYSTTPRIPRSSFSSTDMRNKTYTQSVFGTVQSRTPKSEGLKRWFQENVGYTPRVVV